MLPNKMMVNVNVLQTSRNCKWVGERACCLIIAQYWERTRYRKFHKSKKGMKLKGLLEGMSHHIIFGLHWRQGDQFLFHSWPRDKRTFKIERIPKYAFSIQCIRGPVVGTTHVLPVLYTPPHTPLESMDSGRLWWTPVDSPVTPLVSHFVTLFSSCN